MYYKCKNGNTVERFYDRGSRSSVTALLDPQGFQIGEADYSGNKTTAKSVLDSMIANNGGAAGKPTRKRP